MIVPLTERILTRLGPPRALWIGLWLAILAATQVGASWSGRPFYPGLGYSIVSVYVALIALWGVGLLARRVDALQPDLERLLGDQMDRVRPFARLNAVWMPLLFALLLFAVWQVFVYRVTYPNSLTVVLTILLFVGWIPANAALWMLAVTLLEFDRLGRIKLRLAPFEEDLTLGLRPLGTIAVTAFGMISAAIIPLMIVGAFSARVVVGLLVQYVLVTLLFVLSLWRLHLRLQEAKSQHVAEAGRLYAEALRGVLATWTQDRGNDQAAARLTAAEAIERRAQAIHEWPLGSAMFARAAAIFTAVITGILVRIVLLAVGL